MPEARSVHSSSGMSKEGKPTKTSFATKLCELFMRNLDLGGERHVEQGSFSLHLHLVKCWARWAMIRT